MSKKLVKNSQTSLLNKILADPNLPLIVSKMKTPHLQRLIQHIGLADAGELIALTTEDQLAKLLDDDLWIAPKSYKQTEESFDPRRFALWLEVMHEIGPAFLAEKIIHLGNDFTVAALSYFVLVVNKDDLLLQLHNKDNGGYGDENVIGLLDHVEDMFEFDDYIVLCKNPDAWDVVISLLNELREEDHQFLTTLFENLYQLSVELVDDSGGLYNVATAKSKHRDDAKVARDERREAAGFVSLDEARDFLYSARRLNLENLSELLPEETVRTEEGRALIDGNQEEPNKHVLLIKKLLTDLFKKNPAIREKVNEELNYIGNIFMIGIKCKERRFDPREAVNAIFCTANLGLLSLAQQFAAADVVKEHGLTPLCKIGLAVIQQKLLLPVVERLLFRLDEFTHMKPENESEHWIKNETMKIRRRLRMAMSDGEPWLIAKELDLLSAALPPDELTVYTAVIAEFPLVPREFKAEENFFCDFTQIEKCKQIIGI